MRCTVDVDFGDSVLYRTDDPSREMRRDLRGLAGKATGDLEIERLKIGRGELKVKYLYNACILLATISSLMNTRSIHSTGKWRPNLSQKHMIMCQ